MNDPSKLLIRLIAGIGLALGVACIFSGCRPRAESDPVVIRIGRETVTAGEFRQAMARRGGSAPQVFNDSSNRQALAEELIRSEVMAQAAERAGLLNDPDIQAQVRRLLVARFERELLEKAGDSLRPTSNELVRLYEQDQARYRIPDAVRAALIFVRVPPGATAETRTRLRERAEQARVEALALPADVPHFGPVAARYSDDPSTRYAGGESGWERQGSEFTRWPEAVAKTVAGLTETGRVSGVVETDSGYFLVKLVERRTGAAFPFESVRANVERDLTKRNTRQVLDRAYAEARGRVRIVVDEEALRRVPAPASAPARIPELPPDP